jgi:hypothetical protein
MRGLRTAVVDYLEVLTASFGEQLVPEISGCLPDGGVDLGPA